VPRHAHNPARFEVLHIPSGGVEINGIAYIPPGPGPHPAVLLLHGLPGNEKNLDLAQAMRRAGWTVVSINYRGSWGSPGEFHFGQTLEDADAALAYLRTPEIARKLAVDPKRIAVIGHSMGGWVSAETFAHDPALLGGALISPGDMGHIGQADHAAILSVLQDNRETLAIADIDALADELAAHAAQWAFPALVPPLKDRRLLILYSHDGLQAEALSLIDPLKAARSKGLTAAYTATDHAWSDHRIALQAQVINWLETLPAK
jgi:pimeloyl-ACP methyl ester carboxylesterase